jgi:hypothetical protein
LTKKKKNGKRGNKLRKELSHYYFSMQCASHKTCILYIDIVLPFKQLLTLNQSHYQIVPVRISKYPRKVTCNIMHGGLTILVQVNCKMIPKHHFLKLIIS